MKEKSIKFLTSDGVLLHGILYMPKRKTNKAIIYVHGWASNFYMNPFTDELAKTYTKMGFNYFIFNNRGHDYFTRLNKAGSEKGYIKGGVGFEVFEECEYDIEGAIQVLNKQYNCNKFILEGHSLGCNKVFYYYKTTKNPMVKSLNLIAPCDCVYRAMYILKDGYETFLKQAIKKMKENKGEETLPCKMFEHSGVLPKTFLSISAPGSNDDIFTYRIPNSINKDLINHTLPTNIIMATKDKIAYAPQKEFVVKFLKDNCSGSNYTMTLVEGSDHLFLKHAEKLSKLSKNWILKNKSIFK